MADIDMVVAAYVKARDKKTKITKRHKEELQPLNDAMEQMENLLLKELNAQNLESFKGAHGTAFTTTRSSVKVIDWELALDYALENDMRHVLEKRFAKTAIEEYVENNGRNFPGTDITRDITVQIRRKK